MSCNQKFWGWGAVAVLAAGLFVASLASPLTAGAGQEKDLDARLKAVEEKLQALDEKLDKLAEPRSRAWVGPKALSLEREKLEEHLKKLKEQSKDWDKDGIYRFEFRSDFDKALPPRIFVGPDKFDLRLDEKNFIIPRVFMKPSLTEEEKSQLEALKKTKEWQKLSPKLKDRLEREIESPWLGLRSFWFGTDDAEKPKRKV